MKVLFFLFVFFSFLTLMGEDLKSGDLIFQVEGNGDFSKAISQSTAFSDTLKFVHVGIIHVEEGKVSVIEASPEEGVRSIPLKDFIHAQSGSKLISTFTIKRIKKDLPIDKIIAKAKSYIGIPYDWWYLPGDDKLYCSELIYECYVDNDGNHIFNNQPMNFRAEDGSMPEFWVNLFSQLNQPVPEGVVGTNPQDLSKHPDLIFVTSF